MFGAFRQSMVAQGGLLWKNPWRLSSPRKARVRSRLQAVDTLLDTLRASGVQLAALDRTIAETPREELMEPRDKYTTFSPKGRDFRKSVHKVPKWTRLSLRTNPRGF